MKRRCSLRQLKVVAFCDRYFTVDLIMNLVHYIVMDCFFIFLVSSKKTMYENSDDDDGGDDDDDGGGRYLPI